MTKKRVKLSYPFFYESDYSKILDYLKSINQSNFSDEVDIFEKKLGDYTKAANVVAVSSGTSALHLALLALEISEGDKVLIPTLTFAATAFPVKYVRATPVFIDIEDSTWTINIDLIEKYLTNCDPEDYPKAIIVVDLFGRTCDYNRLSTLCDKYNIKIIVDAAESLGTLYKDNPSTTQGLISIVSFNFIKIITTTGGGAILTNQRPIAEYCRKLANQARENVHWFEHEEIGFNYRLSPLLATLGSSQLEHIDEILIDRRKIRQRYVNNLNSYPGIEVIEDSLWERSNAWLTNVRFSGKIHPQGRDKVRENLEKNNIESRYVWKPLHLQPIFFDAKAVLDGTAERIYLQSLCLPSGSKLSISQVDEICEKILSSLDLL